MPKGTIWWGNEMDVCTHFVVAIHDKLLTFREGSLWILHLHSCLTCFTTAIEIMALRRAQRRKSGPDV